MLKNIIRNIFIFSIILFILFACSPSQIRNEQNDNIVIFPAPPDTTRIQFLTKISSSIDVTGERSTFWEYILGEEEEKPIIKPYGIAIQKGKIYICDTILGLIEIIDLEKNTFDYFLPKGKGLLKKPINCYVDDNNFLYVADIDRHQIVIFDENGKYVECFGDVENGKPVDVFVTEDKIWVCDLKMKRINVHDKKTKKMIYSFPDVPPKTPESLYNPTNLFVINNEVYVTDFGDFKVKKYSKDGQLLRIIGSYGRNLGQFVRPKGIALDKEENLFVVDAGFENVQIFNNEGKLLMFFGGSYTGPGFMWLPAKVIIDYDNLRYFQKYVDKSFDLKYLILVANQYGPDKINIYGFVEPKMSK